MNTQVVDRFSIDWDVTRDEWATCAHADARCSVFQTPEWGDLILRANLALTVRVIGARFSARDKLLLPIAEIWRGRRSRLGAYESMPISAYGGPIIQGQLDKESISRAVAAICLESRLQAQAIVITGNPRLAFHLGAPFVVHALDGQVLDLAGGPEALCEGYSKGFSRDLGIAIKARVAVRHSNSLDDVLAYYALYADSLARWGAEATSRHSKEVFIALNGMPADSYRVWLGEIGQTPVAGVVMLYKGSTAYYWHGAFDGAYARQMPSKAVLHAAAIDAAQRGYERLDMLSSGGHAGVAKFKESMGARTQPLYEYAWRAGGWRKLSHALRGNVARVLASG